MTKREFAVTACRLLAIYELVGSVSSFLAAINGLMFYASYASPPSYFAVHSFPWISELLPTVAHVAVAFFLWVAADGLAERIAPGPEVALAAPSVNDRTLRAVVFSLAGLWFAVEALTGLVGQGSLYHMHPDDPKSAGIAAQCFAYMLQLAIGVALLLGGRGMTGAIHALGQYGLPTTPPKSPGAE